MRDNCGRLKKQYIKCRHVDIVLGLIVIATLLVTVSCSSPAQSDDIVQLPHILVYSGNVDGDGWPLETPQIEEESVELRPPSNVITIRYRRYIEAMPGQRINIIFYVATLIDCYPTEVDIRPVSLPELMTSRIVKQWQDYYEGQSCGALKIEIPGTAPIGEYPFSFAVNINGEDCGTIPCTINLVR